MSVLPGSAAFKKPSPTGSGDAGHSKERAGRSIVLAGNPNVGKSVIFNALTGMSADVSNYPGTTIDISVGHLGSDSLADTPGVYGISSVNDEERTARSMILAADLVINVVSALSLDRDLFLTWQLIDMGLPMILVVNQCDEAENRGMHIDFDVLEKELAIPVVRSIAVNGQGLDEIVQALPRSEHGKESFCSVGDEAAFELVELQEHLDSLIRQGLDRARALLVLEGDECSLVEWQKSKSQLTSSAKHENNSENSGEKAGVGIALSSDVATPDLCSVIYGARRAAVDRLVELCVIDESRVTGFSTKLGRLLIHPLWGGSIALFVCYFLFYQVLGVWIAGDLVEITEEKILKAYWEPNVRRLAAGVFPCALEVDGITYDFPAGISADSANKTKLEAVLSSAGPSRQLAVNYDFWKFPGKIMSIIGNLLVGEYGIVTLTVTYLIGLLMPLVLGFYLGLSLLEDSGYLPRLAVLVDRMMNRIGLNGRAIIPLILGLGCVTMATITTRLLTSEREKLIATALLGIAIPCSAQLGVVSGVLARTGGAVAWAVYGAMVFAILAIAGLLLNMILPGKSQALIIDLPPMRLPRWQNVLKKTWKKSWAFLVEATPMFMLAGLVVTAAQMIGLLDLFIKVLHPIIVNWLRLPDDPRIGTTFILGIVRRDFAAFGLTDVSLSSAQAVIAMIVITLFVPCIATVGVMMKERGWKVAWTIWLGSWVSAFAIGGLLALILPPVFALFGQQ